MYRTALATLLLVLATASLGLAMRRLETMALSGDTVTFSGETHCDMPAAETRSVAELDAISAIVAMPESDLLAACENDHEYSGVIRE